MDSVAARQPLLSVVIPVYNERRTIGEILARVAAAAYDKEIVIVDDASTDGTADYLVTLANGDAELRGPDGGPVPIRVLFQGKNRGKGAALRRGFAESRGEIVLVQDADLEYDPADYPGMLEPIQRGVADVVYGSRFRGGPQRVHLFWHYVGNRTLTLLSNLMTNLNLTDMETCYKAFRREVLEVIGPTLKSDRFGFEPEVTAKVARHGFRVYETPISYHGRDYEAGKKITWRDGMAALYHIVRYRLSD
ncbi:MAG TPA: glycosyltransferase family 2 protein [Gemmatimonadota bacterium]|nr:glycosyltransferase family 2 protein [Gemmatimonadota bacterium]